MANEYPRRDLDLTNKVVDFLKESSEYFSTAVKRRVDDDRMYSGDFWTDELKKEWKRGKRRCEHLSQWGVFDSAIASPLSSSPWHAQLEDQASYTEIQDDINAIESEEDSKNAFVECFRKASDIGANFIVVTTVADEITGEPKIIPECIKDPSAVALDPCVTRASARDAEAGAIVNWINERKAKRLYGDSVFPLNYPHTLPALFDIGDQWKTHPVKSVPIVTYYEKNKAGQVEMYKLCGDLVVEHATLPCSMIPIIRFAAYEVNKAGNIDYIGIVTKTFPLQLGLNLAYSTMLDRMNRSPKANFMYPAGAMDGLEDYLQRCCEDDALALIYNPVEGAVPIQLKEAFETGDLKAILETVRELMAEVLGIPVTGIDQVAAQATATAILEQSANRENNVAQLYNHAYEAMRAVWSIVIQLLNGGKLVKFSLQAGPDVITANMKRRQELQVIAGMLPPEFQPIIAKYYADTLTTDDAKSLSKDIVANLDPSIKLVSNTDLDAYAIHEIKQMKAIADQAMEALEEKNAQIEDLQQKLESAMQELGNKREQRTLEWSKALLEDQQKQRDFQLEVAKAQGAAGIDQQKIDLEEQKVAMEAQDRMEQTIDETNRMMGV